MSAPEPGASPAVPNLPGRPARARRAGPNPFETGGEHYDAVRPSYPAAAVDRVLAGIADGAEVVELGAGTGLFTRLLAARPADRVRTVTALEPSASMRAVLEREVAAGTGGRVRAVPGTGLPSSANCTIRTRPIPAAAGPYSLDRRRRKRSPPALTRTT